MDLTRLTRDHLPDLDDEKLDQIIRQAAYNARLIENRNVIGAAAHRTARRLRTLQFAAERERTGRQAAGSRRGRERHRQDQGDKAGAGDPIALVLILPTRGDGRVRDPSPYGRGGGGLS